MPSCLSSKPSFPPQLFHNFFFNSPFPLSPPSCLSPFPCNNQILLSSFLPFSPSFPKRGGEAGNRSPTVRLPLLRHLTSQNSCPSSFCRSVVLSPSPHYVIHFLPLFPLSPASVPSTPTRHVSSRGTRKRGTPNI